MRLQDGIKLNASSLTFVSGTRWLKIPWVKQSDLGNYSCYASNTLGEVESNPATLTVLTDNTTGVGHYNYFCEVEFVSWLYTLQDNSTSSAIAMHTVAAV